MNRFFQKFKSHSHDTGHRQWYWLVFMTLGSTFKRQFLIIFSAIYALVIIITYLAAFFTIKAKIDNGDIAFMSIGLLALYSILMIAFFVYLTMRLMFYDLRDNTMKIELRYGFHPWNIFISRIIVLICVMGMLVVGQLIIGAIFYGAGSGTIGAMLAYRFFIIPVGWVAIFIVMVVFILTLFAIIMTDRVAVIIAPIFLIVITALSIFMPSYLDVTKPNVIIANDEKNFSDSFSQGIRYDQYIEFNMKAYYESKIYEALNDEQYRPLKTMIDVNLAKDISKNETVDQYYNKIVKLMIANPQLAYNNTLEQMAKGINGIVNNGNPEFVNFSNDVSSMVYAGIKSTDDKLGKVFADIFVNGGIVFNTKDSTFAVPAKDALNNWSKFLKEFVYYYLCEADANMSMLSITKKTMSPVMFYGFSDYSNKMRAKVLSNPFYQMNAMFYGTNYSSPVIYNFTTAGTMPRSLVNYIFNVDFINGSDKDKMKINVSYHEAWHTEVTYLIYVIVMAGAIMLCYFRFKFLVQK